MAMDNLHQEKTSPESQTFDNGQQLSAEALSRTVSTIFQIQPEDKGLALLVDLPDDTIADTPQWRSRREIALDWYKKLDEQRDALGLEQVSLVLYRNAHSNNASLPETAQYYTGDGSTLPDDAASLTESQVDFAEVFKKHQLLMAPTQFSATAPLKLAAKTHGFRAATMAGFKAEMMPALSLDFKEIHERCLVLKGLLDQADKAYITFQTDHKSHNLLLDLRFREAIASSGLLPTPGTAGNYPSGESYIVPYEGEKEPSKSIGEIPLQLNGEVFVMRIERNKVVEVLGSGPVAEKERIKFSKEPGYRNIAELGLGILSAYGIKPMDSTLMDEKLGVHIAFGRSDHFGGVVGPDQFSAPDQVVHIDRIYIPATQPDVKLVTLDLESESDFVQVIRDGNYADNLWNR